jgi:hypothetical protein
MTRRIRPVDLSQLVIGQRLKPQTIVESRTFPADVQFGYDFGMLVRSQAQNLLWPEFQCSSLEILLQRMPNSFPVELTEE